MSCGSAESEPQQEATVKFEVVFLLSWEKQAKRTALVNQAGGVGGKTQQVSGVKCLIVAGTHSKMLCLYLFLKSQLCI